MSSTRAGLTFCLISAALNCGAAQKGDFSLEEVLVTAQKKTESLQDTPISLTAFDSETLEKEGISDLSDLASKVPSLTMEPFPTNNTTLRIFIRGVGLVDAQITQDPPVGVYLDGAYIARSTGLALDIADLQRIEVLRGPQGTLYGRNSTGGTINLVTRRPDTEGLAFKQQVTTGNRNRFSSKTSLNLPLHDTLAVKLAYLSSRKDGFVENTGPGEDFGDREVDGYRLDLRWDINARLQLDYAYDRSQIEFVNYPYQPVFPPNTTPASASTNDIILAQISANAQNFVSYSEDRRSKMATPVPMLASDTEIGGHMLTWKWDLGENLELKLISAWRELEEAPYTDLSGGSRSPDYRIDDNAYTSRDGSLHLSRAAGMLNQEQWSHELQFSGTVHERVEAIVGLYYFEENAESGGLPGRHHQSTTPLSITDTPTSTITTFAVTTVGGNFTIDNSAWALYGRATWTPPILEDRLHLTLGARYSEDQRDATKTVDNQTLIETETRDKTTGQTTASPPTPAGGKSFSAAGSNTYHDDSYEFIGEYEVSDTSNVYLKYAEAYKSGGYNTREPDEALFRRGFDQEKVNSYELGVKSEWLDRRLRINGDVFFSEYTDIQMNFKIPGGIADSRVVNAGEAEMKGLELEVDFLLTPGLLLRLNYAYLDAEIVEAIDPNTGADVTDEFIFSSAPEHSYTASLDWTVADFVWGRLGLNLSYNYMDDRNGSTRKDISADIFLPNYDLLNARVGLYDLSVLDGNLTIAAWGKNLQDNEYAINGLAALPHASRAVIWGEPRSYGLDMIFRY